MRRRKHCKILPNDLEPPNSYHGENVLSSYVKNSDEHYQRTTSLFFQKKGHVSKYSLIYNVHVRNIQKDPCITQKKTVWLSQ